MKIIMTEIRQTKKVGTQTVWINKEQFVEEISDNQYRNITERDTLQWFRRLGGSESATKNYTQAGYKIVQLISTSPDKTNRTLRYFRFDD